MTLAQVCCVVVNTAKLNKDIINEQWLKLYATKPTKIIELLNLDEVICNLPVLNAAKEICVDIPPQVLSVMEMLNRPEAPIQQILTANWDIAIQSLVLVSDKTSNKNQNNEKAALHLRKNLKLTQEDNVLLQSTTFTYGLLAVILEKVGLARIHHAYHSAYAWLASHTSQQDKIAVLVDSRLELTCKLETTFQAVKESLLTEGEEFGPWDVVHLAYDVKSGEKLIDYDETLVQGCSKLSQVYATLVSSGSFSNIVEIMDAFSKEPNCLLTCSPKLLTRFIAKDNGK